MKAQAKMVDWLLPLAFITILVSFMATNRVSDLYVVFRKVFFLHGNIDVNVTVYSLCTLILLSFRIIERIHYGRAVLFIVSIVFLFQVMFAIFLQAILVLNGASGGPFEISFAASSVLIVLLPLLLFRISSSRQEWVLALLSVVVSGGLGSYQAWAIIISFTS